MPVRGTWEQFLSAELYRPRIAPGRRFPASRGKTVAKVTAAESSRNRAAPAYAGRRRPHAISRTWLRKIDRWKASSCAISGAISERNGSARTAAASRARRLCPSRSRSQMSISSAVASRCSDDSVGTAFPFSILEMYVRGTCILPASCRWLSERSRLASRTARATSIPSALSAGCAPSVTSCGVSGSGSSISRGLWQRRHSEFAVRNCTRLQDSQRSTSRASTVANVVAIDCAERQSGRSGLTERF